MHKLNPIKKNGVAHYGATPALSFLIIILFSFGFAQNNIFVAGATPAASTNDNGQQVQNYIYAQTNVPDYCQTPANQNRPECQTQAAPSTNTTANTTTNTTTNTIATTQPLNTQSHSNYPAYCQTPTNQSRPECQGYNQFPSPVTSVIPVTSNRPQYCSSPQYQHLAECQIIFMTPPTPPIELICSEPRNALTPLCQEYFANLPKPPIPMPPYCREPINQSRPECRFSVTPPIVISPTPPPFCQPNNYGRDCIPQPRPCTGPYDPLCTPQFPPYIQPPFVPTPPYIPTPPTTICNPNYPPINCIQPPRPCIVGIFDPLCNVVPPQPVCPPNYMPAPPPTMCIPLPIISPPITVPPVPPFDPNRTPPPPPPCPMGSDNLRGGECIDESDFALPFPPANQDCQNLQRYPSDALTKQRVCSAFYFTHAGAYKNNSPIATIRPNQNLSFIFRSPFTGFPYFFTKSSDGKLHQLPLMDISHLDLPPNTPPPAPPIFDVYSQTSIPFPVPFNPNKDGFKVQDSLTDLFAVILTRPPPANTFSNLSSKAELDQILIGLGMNEGIYHGFVGTILISTNY